jgi:hypothetical protein
MTLLHAVLYLSAALQPAAPLNVTLSIDAAGVGALGTVSPFLASMSIVYAWAPNAAGYANGTIARWANEHHLNTARYPAGMASYWNWENPSGMMGESTLSPEWIKSGSTPAPAPLWMDLEEYLSLCNATSMTPLIGAYW